jgi:hypothetical protein
VLRGDADGHHRGRGAVPLLEVCAVRAFEGFDGLVGVGYPIRRLPQQVKPVPGEGAGSVGLRERVVRLLPRVALERVASNRYWVVGDPHHGGMVRLRMIGMSLQIARLVQREPDRGAFGPPVGVRGLTGSGLDKPLSVGLLRRQDVDRLDVRWNNEELRRLRHERLGHLA